MLQICSKYASNMQYNIGAIFRGCVLTAIIFSASLKKTLLPICEQPINVQFWDQKDWYIIIGIHDCITNTIDVIIQIIANLFFKVFEKTSS
jgi:hypothetical protein